MIPQGTTEQRPKAFSYAAGAGMTLSLISATRPLPVSAARRRPHGSEVMVRLLLTAPPGRRRAAIIEAAARTGNGSETDGLLPIASAGKSFGSSSRPASQVVEGGGGA